MEEKEQWTMQNIRAIYEAGPSEEEMIKRRRRSKRIRIICMGVAILLLILWFIAPWLETVCIVKRDFGVNLLNLDCEYEYENTLERFSWGGYILVKFTTTPEQAEELLSQHWKDLNEKIMPNYYKGRTDLSEDEIKEWEEMEAYEKFIMGRRLKIAEDTLNGKSKRLFTKNRMYTPVKITCKCVHPEYVHVQENTDKTVTVYLYYSE